MDIQSIWHDWSFDESNSDIKMLKFETEYLILAYPTLLIFGSRRWYLLSSNSVIRFTFHGSRVVIIVAKLIRKHEE